MNSYSIHWLLLLVLASSVIAQPPPVDMQKRAEELKNLKWGMFICWSFSTFSGKEWTPGITDLSHFRATSVDTDQWARTAKEAGMGYILFLTKHHDGFCLWDTKTTDRKVTNAPLGRDVLAELKKSCDKHGIKLALYFSEGEWRHPGGLDHPDTTGQKKNNQGGRDPEVKKAQLKELLTQYGPIEYIWFDHAVGDGGLSHAETLAFCKALQPGCFIGFNHGDQTGADIRLGEMGKPGPLTDHAAAGPHMKNTASKDYLLAEFTYPIQPRRPKGAVWFYSHPENEEVCHSAEKLYQDYLGAVKFGNIFSIAVGPDYNGRLRAIDVKTLREVGALIHPARSAGLAGTKPNVIVVITDDQGYGPVGRHGHPWLNTPNLDTLHDASSRFTCFHVAPTCAPTRSALMSGRHPEKNGVTHTFLERERMAPATVTLPDVLRAAGYTTGIFGKWHLGDEAGYQPEKRGFDEVFIHGAGGIGQKYEGSLADAPGNTYQDPVIRHNGRFVKTTGYCTDVFFRAALGWIRQRKDAGKPFFAYISTNAPHSPFIAPPGNAKRFTDLGFGNDQAGFYGMVENIDENMGLLFTKLAEWHLLENTVVIFMSDNGMTGGGSGLPEGKGMPEGMPPYNAGMKGLKGSVDEGGTRVPFFIYWEGRIAPNRDIGTLAAHIDFFPTVAALAGARLPADQVEGRSLLPLLENPHADWPDRFVFTQVCRWPAGADPDAFQWENFSVRSQRFRLVGVSELYDMEKDPGQTRNVSAGHPETVAAMKAAHAEYWEQARPLMVNEDAIGPATPPYHRWFEEQMKAGGIPAWNPPEL
jgi:arylsulfatase A-like enzyme/alpha-L-fucosidase